AQSTGGMRPPVKIARSTPRPSFGLRELLVASHISRLASRDAAKSLLSTLVSESSGECRLNSRLADFHSRFGRGRGKGTARRSTTAICAGCVKNGVEDAKKATIGSSDADLRTVAALGTEPVSNSLVGTCLPPPLISRTASRLTTRIVATP